MIVVENMSIHQGAFRLVGVSFALGAGDYGVLMGRTGAGKTTILEAICGLRRVEAGRIVLGGRDVTMLKPAERGIGYVPQDGALFASMTVGEQIAFPLHIRRWSEDAAERRVSELAQMLGIEHLLPRRIAGLSGGEQQRVALGRALSFAPGVLCLDEPLSALDEETRRQMYDLLRTVRERTGVTTLHVTHNPAETRTLADRLFVLEGGAVVERDVDELRREEAGVSPAAKLR